MLPIDEETMLLDEEETEEEILPSLTWKLNEDTLSIEEQIDDLDAIKQALYLILRTEREEFEIYSEDYGVELVELFGQSAPLVYVNIEDAIKEALLQDDRVEDVGNFEFDKTSKDSVSVKFIVTTIQGDIDMETEVEVYG